MLNQEDAIAFVDACLDGQLTFKQIVDQVREQDPRLSIITGADVTVHALKQSKHPMALIMLHRIKSSISRYQGLVLPQFSEVADDGS